MPRVSTEQRQEQIINEAIKIINRKGYSGLSIRELAQNVGISEPAIYRHFHSKEEIILGILDRLVRFGEQIQQKLISISDPKEKIKQLVRTHLEFLEKNPQMTSVIFSEDIFEPRDIIKRKITTIVQSRLQTLGQLIDEARQAGEVADVPTEDLSTVILGYIRMVVLEWRMANFSFSLQERGERVIHTLEKIIFTKD